MTDLRASFAFAKQEVGIGELHKEFTHIIDIDFGKWAGGGRIEQCA